MDTGIESSLLARLLHSLVYELFRLAEHLFDAGGVDTAIGDKVLHGDAADFTADRIEAGDGYAFRRIVDDEIGAGKLLERADVAALTADDAALQVIGRDMDRRNGGFGGMICSYTLNGKAEDGACLLIGLRLGASLGIADDSRGLVRHLVFKRIEKLGFRLIGSHARNLLQANADLLFGLVKIALAAIKLALHGGDLMLAGV